MGERMAREKPVDLCGVDDDARARDGPF